MILMIYEKRSAVIHFTRCSETAGVYGIPRGESEIHCLHPFPSVRFPSDIFSVVNRQQVWSPDVEIFRKCTFESVV